jgi:hypothetical protein
MSAVPRPLGAILTAALLIGGCASEPEKQWYKPGGSYTMAEFERDRAACTKSRALDEACLKERGWIAISGDRAAPAPKDPPKRY